MYNIKHYFLKIVYHTISICSTNVYKLTLHSIPLPVYVSIRGLCRPLLICILRSSLTYKNEVIHGTISQTCKCYTQHIMYSVKLIILHAI